jgi:hypothetical protein
MRVAVRILTVVSIIVSATAVGLFYWTTQANLPDIDVRGYLFILAGGIGFLVGLSTFIVGLVATAQRRQIAWLIGLIAAWLLTIVGTVMADILLQYYQPALPSVCQIGGPTPPPASECQFMGMQLILANLPTWVFLAGPLLVGVVGLIYSFRMRDPVAATPMARR